MEWKLIMLILFSENKNILVAGECKSLNTASRLHVYILDMSRTTVGRFCD